MKTHNLKIADTSITFRMSKCFTPKDPYHKTIHYQFELNGTKFSLVYKMEGWDSYEQTFKNIVSNMLNIMLSRVAWPTYMDTQRNKYAEKFR